METLADFGTVSYFGVEVFTTGIFKAWLSMGDSVAAAQLSTCLLGFVVVLLALERANRGRAAYHGIAPRKRARRTACAAPRPRRALARLRGAGGVRLRAAGAAARAGSRSRRTLAAARLVALVGEQLRASRR